MLSMTGYGESHFILLGIRFHYRIKSVNSRFLETEYILPREIKWFELTADKLIKKRFVRGKFAVFLEMDQAIPKEPKLNKNLIQEYQKLFCTIYPKKKAILPIETLVQLPGFFELRSSSLREYNSKIEFHFIKSLLKLEQAQKKEGRNIHRLIKIKLGLMTRTVGKISLLSKQHIEKQEKLAKNKVASMEKMIKQTARSITREDQQISNFFNVVKEEFFQFLYNDITEEIDRLNIHLASIIQFIEEEKVIGKKIEFFLQEMLREVNTLTSKTKDMEINLLGIQMKSDIEKIREHARNIV